MGRGWAVVGTAALVGAVALVGAWRWQAPERGAAPRRGEPRAERGRVAFPVELQTIEPRRVEYELEAVGSVEAFEVVAVTARVGGVVDRLHFAEGDAVVAGETLAEIDPERYRLAVRAAEAALERSQASALEVKAGLDPREAMLRTRQVAREEVEAWRARYRAAGADVVAAEVALERARLDLSDALVRAPRPGRAQSRPLRTGQWIQPGDVITTLVDRDPLLLRLHLPEAEAARVASGTTASFRVRGAARDLGARVVHVAEAADPATRMVAVVAHVDSDDRLAARPGAFAEVRLPVGAADALVIPQTAVRPSERGFLAYVVEGEGDAARAVERTVRLGLRTADGQVEVQAGLRAGERLVVRGAEALRDGAAVRTARPPG